jgi:hypothetical protein
VFVDIFYPLRSLSEVLHRPMMNDRAPQLLSSRATQKIALNYTLHLPPYLYFFAQYQPERMIPNAATQAVLSTTLHNNAIQIGNLPRVLLSDPTVLEGNTP